MITATSLILKHNLNDSLIVYKRSDRNTFLTLCTVAVKSLGTDIGVSNYCLILFFMKSDGIFAPDKYEPAHSPLETTARHDQ